MPNSSVLSNTALASSTANESSQTLHLANSKFAAVDTTSIRNSDGSYGPFTLTAGQSLNFAGGFLAMQLDGNLVEYVNGSAVWAASFSPSMDGSPVSGRNCNACSANFQPDGNLVLYSGSRPYWQSATSGISSASINLLNVSPYLQIMSENLVVFPKTTIVCAVNAANNDQIDATPIIQACLAQHPLRIELKPGRYFLNSTLDFSENSNLSITTSGVSSGDACLTAHGPACAVLTASPSNLSPKLLVSYSATNLNFSYVAIDGNNSRRRFKNPTFKWPANGYNATIVGCTNCKFIGFASVRAVQGTGLEFTGDNAIFDRTLFRDNGFGIVNASNNPSTWSDGTWSDGLTVLSSNNLRITNSIFMDNSDIDLIIGNSQNGLVENNTIGNKYNFAFGALMLDNFNGATGGNFTGAIIRNNKIDCGNGMCGLGIDIGPHQWYQSSQVYGGDIHGNSINGAVQGIITAGANTFSIYGNNIVSSVAQHSGFGYTTNLLSYSPGDNVSISGNNISPTLSAMVGCPPQLFPKLLPVISGANVDVLQAYRDILGRDADSSGAISYTTAINSGKSIADVRQSLAESPEAQDVLNNLYLRVFGRAIDQSGASSWRSSLAAGNTVAQIYVQLQLTSEGFASSEGFENRVR